MEHLKIIGGNRVTLLKNGGEFFPALLATIDAANEDIRLETYIFRDDAAGIGIRDALLRAAGRGVNIHVLIDGFGSKGTPWPFFAAMENAGIKLLVFRPEGHWFHIHRNRLRRMHRKIALIDGKVGFVGGLNLIDDLTESMSPMPRYDYAARIEGPLLQQIYPAVHQLWSRTAGQASRREEADDPPPRVHSEKAGVMQAAFVLRDNFRHRRDIELAYRQAIGRATRYITITSPYFLPGRRMRHALLAAANRGVKVTLLLQGRADHPLLQQATRALYTQLLAAGVDIHEYQTSMLHGKVAVIDDHWATVGSSNLDPFSLFLNREANVIVLDETFATHLRESVQEEIQSGATACDAADWQKRAWWPRVQSWAAYGLARLMSGWMGFARDWR
jgi:cardiolipin synthase